MFEKSKWITFPQEVSVASFLQNIEFEKPVKKALMHISASGWYRLFVNDDLYSDSYFAPGYTDYKYRTMFQTYNVTKSIKENTKLEMMLAPGWGGTKHIAFTIGSYPYNEKSLIFDLEVTFEDDQIEHYFSKEGIDVYTNEIVFAEIYHGETYDQSNRGQYLGKAILANVETNLIENEGERIIEGERIPAKKMYHTPNGQLVVDFEQNFAGVVEINIDGKKGDKIIYQPGEVLDVEGNVYTKNYRAAKSTYTIVLDEGKHTYKPVFSWLGGRYLIFHEYPSYLKKENVTAVLIHSELEKTCEFECGNAKINRLYKNVIYGQLSNYLDIPTDCPQRDERAGWTADAQVFARTAAINFDVHKFFQKWINDMILGQDSDGGMAVTIPSHHKKWKNYSTGWGDACVVCPYEIYRAYNDLDILRKTLPMMKKWVNFLTSYCKKPHLPDLPFSFGDWLALDKVQETGQDQGLTDFVLITTCYYAYDIEKIIEISKLLGEPYEEYETLLSNVKKAYQDEFIIDGHIKGEPAYLFSNIDRTPNTQTAMILTLFFNMCKEEDRKTILDDLVKRIHDCGDKMTTGFLGTPYILHALSDNGRSDIAYNLLFEEGYPSWLYSVNKGATTMWEHYDGIKEDGSFWSDEMNSYNHYAYGSVFDWIFSDAVGIKLVKPAYEEIEISPVVDSRLGHVYCNFKTKFGTINVKWEILEEKVHYSFDIPRGIKATIKLNKQKDVQFLDGGHLDVVI